jgi:hypothetical protein
LSRRNSSCRRGSEAKCRSPASSSLGCARQRLEEGEPAVLVEMAVAVEHLARHRGAGSLAAARQQRLAQFDQVGGILFGVRWPTAAKQVATALRNRGEKIGEKSVAAHVSDVGPKSGVIIT